MLPQDILNRIAQLTYYLHNETLRGEERIELGGLLIKWKLDYDTKQSEESPPLVFES